MGDESCLSQTVTATGIGLFAGVIAGTAVAGLGQNFTTEKAGEVMRQSSKIIGKHTLTLGLIGGLYTVSRCELQSIRHTNDIYNSVIAGAITGLVVGLKGGKISRVVGTGLAFAGIAGAYHLYDQSAGKREEAIREATAQKSKVRLLTEKDL